jgi:hypothetical protein
MNKWSIPTKYKGIKYRSKLEASWAKFFDTHRMKFAYEPEGFNFDGVLYLPDFWLPEIKTIVEVKGVLEETDREKLLSLAVHAAPRGIMVILAEAPAGENYKLIYPSPQTFQNDEAPYIYEEFEEVSLCRCANCRRWYFRENLMGWQCTACGFYDGDRTFDLVHHKINSTWSYDPCPDCGA